MPEYRIWAGMIQRCTNPKNTAYHQYGGRGITVWPRWRETFDAFFMDMGRKPANTTLDRIDSDGNYEPSNCRWATRTEQQRNRRDTRTHTIDGITRSLAEWAEVTGATVRSLEWRIRRGWPDSQFLMAPNRGNSVTRKARHQVRAADGTFKGDAR